MKNPITAIGILLLLHRATAYVHQRKIQNRIVDGEPAGSPIDYQALIKVNGYFTCGGILIASDVVITAAHCQQRYVSSYTVELGVYNRSNAQEASVVTREVIKQVIHPEYDEYEIDHDIMLLYLSEEISEFEPIELNEDDSLLQEGDVLTISGWGRPSLDDPTTSVLMTVDVEYVSNDQCVEIFEDFSDVVIDDWELCAFEDSKGACKGDSGGPLVLPNGSNNSPLLVGIVSWGIGCAYSLYPGVFVRVSHYRQWIKPQICFEFSKKYSFCEGLEMPSQSPSASSQPSILCTDYMGYKDSYGDSCSWYEENDAEGCPIYGDVNGDLFNSPNDACCYCGGGLNIKSYCTDFIDFEDAGGDGCDWYTRRDSYGCPLHGSSYENLLTGLTASDACCYCGGGNEYLPSYSPSSTYTLPSHSSIEPTISTYAPSSEPSISPISMPTQLPTKEATFTPTVLFSNSPSLHSSTSPTTTLSNFPTISSTRAPTITWTLNPSSRSMHPTDEPTSGPTIKWTADPSSRSMHPTNTPTIEPTIEWTADPSARSMYPTNTPTIEPTMKWTADPSFQSMYPTDKPTIAPTLQWTTDPSFRSMYPTNTSTSRPTIKWTAEPSFRSMHPTDKVTSAPTIKWTVEPSSRSMYPTNTPTSGPTIKRTVDPSSRSMNPTNIPTSGPTIKWTAEPSSRSMNPINTPTGGPTIEWTINPSSRSKQPTNTPTSLSSGPPSVRSSDFPTSLPSVRSSSRPTSSSSLRPTFYPTSSPSVSPTLHLSRIPTTEPTDIFPSLPTMPPINTPTTKWMSSPSTNLNNEPTIPQIKQETLSPSDLSINVTTGTTFTTQPSFAVLDNMSTQRPNLLSSPSPSSKIVDSLIPTFIPSSQSLEPIISRPMAKVKSKSLTFAPDLLPFCLPMIICIILL